MTKTLLDIYLNDHLAAATGAAELARRSARANRGTGCGVMLAGLAEEIEQDRRTLAELMQALDVGIDRLKQAAGWSAEKLGRFKLNGQILGYSPLSRLLELEVLALGVTGKQALWRTLQQLERPELARFDLEHLISRAQDQLQRLEAERRTAAALALR